jgi:mannosylglycoprotein endo-beta-mannosidase
MARERSRVRQLREGDANTAYFHLIARGRRRRNYIPALSVQGHVITNHDDMELALHSHFAGVFGSVQGGGFTINFQALGIQRLNLDEMDLAISSEEVWAAIRALPSDRAPGPDGFTGAFYKSAWPIIHQDIMDDVQAFQHGSTRNPFFFFFLIALLPKKVGASCPADSGIIIIILMCFQVFVC